MNRYFIFYTRATPYTDLAIDCAKSFRAHGLWVDVRALSERKSTWMGNCLSRSIVLDQLASSDLYKEDCIGLLDADLKCLQKPTKLIEFSGDVAVHDLGEQTAPCSRYSAGVIVFGSSEHGRSCLRDWATRCAMDEKPDERLREQVYLFEAIEAMKRVGGVVEDLGRDYNESMYEENAEACRLAQYNEQTRPSTVIQHLVVSRKLRPIMGGSL